MEGKLSIAGRYAAVLDVAERYLRAMHQGDADLLRAIWHPTGRAYKVKPGMKDVIVEGLKDLTEILDKVQKCPKDLVALDAVDSVDFAGPDTAIVRVHYAMPPSVCTEFLSILLHGGEWRIVSRVSTSINHMLVSDISFEDLSPREPSEALRGFVGKLDNYFLGWHGANVDELKEIFHDVATLHCAEGVRLPRIRSRGVFFEQMRAGSIDFNPNKLKYDKVLKIEKAGQYVAMVKLQLGYPPALFTSHLSLLFVGERWQIVSESIYSQAFELEAKPGAGEGDAVRKFFSATPYKAEKPKTAGPVGGDKWQGYLQSLLNKSSAGQPSAGERLNANRLSAAAKKPEPIKAPEPVKEVKPKQLSPQKRTADILNNMPSLSHANSVCTAYMDAGSYVDKMSVLATLEGGVLVERQLLRGLETNDLSPEEMTQVYDYFDQKAEREGRLSRVNRPKAASPPPPPAEETAPSDEEVGAEESTTGLEAADESAEESKPLNDEDFFAGIPNRQVKPIVVQPLVRSSGASTSPTNYTDVLSQMGPSSSAGFAGEDDDDDDDADFQMLDELGDGAL
jgi:hypothetical protein